MFEITYFGNATFEIQVNETTILIDPYVSENPECPYSLQDVMERAAHYDALCVTHLAEDHLGDCLTLATGTDTPVLTEPATAHYLEDHGLDESRITSLVWGQRASVEDLEVRGLEAHHISAKATEEGYLTGQPLAFLVSSGEESIIHTGDTSIFSDLELFGDLYEPAVALLGIGQAHSADERTIEKNIAEVTLDEALLITDWLQSDQVIPMHYLPEEKAQFVDMVEQSDVSTDVCPLQPGESFHVDGSVTN